MTMSVVTVRVHPRLSAFVRVCARACGPTLATTMLAGAFLPAQQIDVSPAGSLRSIAAAVSAARPGGRIVVHAGTYREPMIVVDKRLEIVGDGQPVLDGEYAHGLLLVTAD